MEPHGLVERLPQATWEIEKGDRCVQMRPLSIRGSRGSPRSLPLFIPYLQSKVCAPLPLLVVISWGIIEWSFDLSNGCNHLITSFPSLSPLLCTSPRFRSFPMLSGATACDQLRAYQSVSASRDYAQTKHDQYIHLRSNSALSDASLILEYGRLW